jgi:hypothetical protein
VGIELWNLMSDWGEHLTRRSKELLFFLPLAWAGRRRALDWWDRLNVAGKRTFGVGGVDAHAFKKRAPWGQVEVFDYTWIFGTLTNYLLLRKPRSSDPRAATHQVYAALAEGRLYFVNRLDGDCPELLFHAARRGDRWTIGDARACARAAHSAADVGRRAEVQLIRDGRWSATARAAPDDRRAGVYRLEAIAGRPWLYQPDLSPRKTCVNVTTHLNRKLYIRILVRMRLLTKRSYLPS